MNGMKGVIIGVAGIKQHGREMWCGKIFLKGNI